MSQNKTKYEKYILLLFLSVIIFLFTYFDVFEAVFNFTRTLETFELDDCILGVGTAFVFIFFYIILKIYERNRILKKLIEESKIDRMTNLPNHLAFREDYETYKLNDDYIILIQLGNYNLVNMTFGIEYGDILFKNISQKLQQTVKEQTGRKTYRTFGGVFAFFISGSDNSEIIKTVSLIRDTIENTEFRIKNFPMYARLYVSASNTMPKYKHAKLALEYAVTNFNNEIVFYDKTMDISSESEKNISMITIIRESIEKDFFVPFFQPIIDNNNGEIIKNEALIRIVKNNTIIPPGEFLPISKKFKYYSSISKVMLEKTFRFFSERKDGLSINFSHLDIENDWIVDYFFDLLTEYPGLNERLTVEILESEEVISSGKLEKFRKRLLKNNIRLAIDDFGSGYSNWINMLKLHPDYLKIDGSIIRDVLTSVENRNILDSIVIFAEKNKIKTVAEFVSSREIWEYVRNNGIDYSQGYFFSKPREFTKLYPESFCFNQQ